MDILCISQVCLSRTLFSLFVPLCSTLLVSFFYCFSVVAHSSWNEEFSLSWTVCLCISVSVIASWALVYWIMSIIRSKTHLGNIWYHCRQKCSLSLWMVAFFLKPLGMRLTFQYSDNVKPCRESLVLFFWNLSKLEIKKSVVVAIVKNLMKIKWRSTSSSSSWISTGINSVCGGAAELSVLEIVPDAYA